jgi:hypothetical protein
MALWKKLTNSDCLAMMNGQSGDIKIISYLNPVQIFIFVSGSSKTINTVCCIWQVEAHIGGVGGRSFTNKSIWPNISFHFKGKVNQIISPEPSICIHTKWTHGFSIQKCCNEIFDVQYQLKIPILPPSELTSNSLFVHVNLSKNVIFSHEFEYLTY